MRFPSEQQNFDDFDDFENSEELDSESEFDSLDEEEFIYTDMDQLSFEGVEADYFSIGYVDPSDFEY